MIVEKTVYLVIAMSIQEIISNVMDRMQDCTTVKLTAAEFGDNSCAFLQELHKQHRRNQYQAGVFFEDAGWLSEKTWTPTYPAELLRRVKSGKAITEDDIKELGRVADRALFLYGRHAYGF